MRCITLKVYSVVPNIYTSVTGVWLSCREGKLNKCAFIRVCVCVCVYFVFVKIKKLMENVYGS